MLRHLLHTKQASQTWSLHLLRYFSVMMASQCSTLHRSDEVIIRCKMLEAWCLHGGSLLLIIPHLQPIDTLSIYVYIYVLHCLKPRYHSAMTLRAQWCMHRCLIFYNIIVIYIYINKLYLFILRCHPSPSSFPLSWLHLLTIAETQLHYTRKISI